MEVGVRACTCWCSVFPNYFGSQMYPSLKHSSLAQHWRGNVLYGFAVAQGFLYGF